MTGDRRSPKSRRTGPTIPGCQLAGSWTLLRPLAGCGGLDIRSEWPVPRRGTLPPCPSRVMGHGPCHRPCSTVEATWPRPTGRGLRFVCRRDGIAAASETPSRERYSSLRRPGGAQSNRQVLPLLGGLPSDAGSHKRWESGADVDGAYPRPEGRGLAPVFHVSARPGAGGGRDISPNSRSPVRLHEDDVQEGRTQRHHEHREDTDERVAAGVDDADRREAARRRARRLRPAARQRRRRASARGGHPSGRPRGEKPLRSAPRRTVTNFY